MGVEQAIFTVCESGITSTKPGLKIYSYSSGMETILTSTDASILFQYEAPREQSRGWEKAKKELPRKYAYAIVEDTHPLVGFAANHPVYLNGELTYFSHLLVTNLLNVTSYPCEYYKSPLFLEGLSDVEQKSKKRPEYLYKAIHLKRGQAITQDSVRNFLLKENRFPTLKKLYAALLSGNQEEEQKKIVLIGRNEGEENELIYWIAAMTMALPPWIARQISFSDYEYEPLASPYRICGTRKEGCRLPINRLMKETHVFDLTTERVTNGGVTEELLDVFELSFRVSKDCILPFYEFMEHYQYYACDEQLYDAYELYKLVTVREYMTKMTRQKLHKAFVFADRYAREEERKRFTAQVLAFLQDGRGIEGRILKEVLWYLKQQAEKGKVVKQTLYLPLLHILYESFRRTTKEEGGYQSTVKEIAYFFEQTGTSVYRYYLGYLPETEVGLLLRKTVNHWKLREVLRIIKEYLLVKRPTITEVAEDKKLNHLVNALLIRTDSTCKTGKGIEIEEVWKTFCFSYEYATYCYLLLWKEEEKESRQAAAMEHFYEAYYWTLDGKERKAATQYLLFEEERTVVRLLHYRYGKEASFSSWFSYVTEFIESNEIYGGALLDNLMQECFENAVRGKNDRYEAVLLLFQYTFKIGYRDRFINRLVPYLSASIPLVASSKDQITLIRRLYYYQVNFNGGMVEKRVALCYRLYELKEFLASNPKKREKITFHKKVQFPTIDGAETENYMKRAGTVIGEIIFKNGQASLVHDCYQLSKEKEQKLLLYVYETLLRKGRKRKDYMMFFHVFVYAMEDTEMLPEVISRSGVKVEELTDELMFNMNHLIAYRKLIDHGGNKGERIAALWCRIVKRVLKPE